MVLLCSYSLLTLVSILVVVVFSHNGNDLKQYKKYRHQISNYTTGEDYFPGVTACEKAPPNSCWACRNGFFGRMNVSHSETNSLIHWEKTVPWNESSCQYQVKQIETSFSFPAIHLRITQYSCSDSFHPAGGSSFYILSEGFFQQICDVEDRFDNSYDVYCPITPPSLHLNTTIHKYIQDSLNNCMYVTIFLDYEHFDAFSEVGNYGNYFHRFRPLDKRLINQQKFCFLPSSVSNDNIINNNQHSQEAIFEEQTHPHHQSHHQRDSNKYHRGKLWDDNLMITGYWMLKHFPKTSEELLELAKNPFNYEWNWWNPSISSSGAEAKSQEESFQTIVSQNLSHCYIKNFEEPKSPMKVYFLGASHLRYMFDYLIHEAYPDFMSRLNWKIIYHVLAENYLQYDHKVFNIQLAEFIDHIIDEQTLSHCNENVTFIIEPGTWDISFWWSPRATIENPMASPYLWKIFDYLQNNPCAKNFHVIWMEIHPYPRCYQRDRPDETPENLASCFQKQNRNNYAMNALSEYYENYFYHHSYWNNKSSTQFRIIKNSDLLFPRFLVSKYVCDNHYLCPKNLEDRSKEGILQAKMIQIAACQLARDHFKR
jgi:hypothetical protein